MSKFDFKSILGNGMKTVGNLAVQAANANHGHSPAHTLQEMVDHILPKESLAGLSNNMHHAAIMTRVILEAHTDPVADKAKNLTMAIRQKPGFGPKGPSLAPGMV